MNRSCKVYNSKNVKLLKTKELDRLSRTKLNTKCCKDLEPNKWVKIDSWKGSKEAKTLLNKTILERGK